MPTFSKTLVSSLASASLLAGLMALSPAALADRDHERDRHHERHDRRDDRHDRHDNRYDRMHRPDRVVVVKRPPRGHRVVEYHGDRYYYGGGRWYRPQGPDYVVVRPPIGITLSFLPTGYVQRSWRGTRYYVHDNVYYRRAGRSYVVVERPW
ncbi:DUF6515 family protein [Chitinimonas koreensis]|uniref:DUF6515 family protein n=1 Tax=Chitinimonas koreensis TaxID=356302 RepID=UPI00041445B4|nr:DUF6515 family protein [Chitinimonas koreensis]QNM96074.1 hypothetical protein H9L41_20005 [Chitinimonas koreensis]